MDAVINVENVYSIQKPTKKETAGGIAAGFAVNAIVNSAVYPTQRYCILKNKNLNTGVDTVEINKALDKALEVSKMKDAGVRIWRVTDTGGKLAKKYEALGKIEKILFKQDTLNAIKLGENAGYNTISNTILINPEKLPLAGFHEIGHSINRNTSKFWSILQKSNIPAMAAVGLIATIAIFKRKKAKGEEPKGCIDKTTTFIKENAGKLTTLAFVPMVAEELKATYNGNKLAKQLLSAENFKKVVKSNKFGAATYIGAAIISGLAAMIGSKTRDAIAKPKQVQAQTLVDNG